MGDHDNTGMREMSQEKSGMREIKSEKSGMREMSQEKIGMREIKPEKGGMREMNQEKSKMRETNQENIGILELDLQFLDLNSSLHPLDNTDKSILDAVVKPPPIPLPGDCRVWITPARSPDCEFGDATAMFKSLQLNPNAAVFQIPSSDKPGKKLNAASAPFIPHIPIPSQHQHAQTIHINNLTTNLNYVLNSDNQSVKMPLNSMESGTGQAMPIPFAVSGSYPGYIHPFQQSQGFKAAGYQSPVVVCQDITQQQQFFRPVFDKRDQTVDFKACEADLAFGSHPPVVSVKGKLYDDDDVNKTPAPTIKTSSNFTAISSQEAVKKDQGPDTSAQSAQKSSVNINAQSEQNIIYSSVPVSVLSRPTPSQPYHPQPTNQPYPQPTNQPYPPQLISQPYTQASQPYPSQLVNLSYPTSTYPSIPQGKQSFNPSINSFPSQSQSTTPYTPQAPTQSSYSPQTPIHSYSIQQSTNPAFQPGSLPISAAVHTPQRTQPIQSYPPNQGYSVAQAGPGGLAVQNNSNTTGIQGYPTTVNKLYAGQHPASAPPAPQHTNHHQSQAPFVSQQGEYSDEAHLSRHGHQGQNVHTSSHIQGPHIHVQQGPPNHVQQGPPNHVQQGPSSHVQQTPLSHVQQVPSHVQQQGSGNSKMLQSGVQQGPSNNAQMGSTSQLPQGNFSHAQQGQTIPQQQANQVQITVQPKSANTQQNYSTPSAPTSSEARPLSVDQNVASSSGGETRSLKHDSHGVHLVDGQDQRSRPAVPQPGSETNKAVPGFSASSNQTHQADLQAGKPATVQTPTSQLEPEPVKPSASSEVDPVVGGGQREEEVGTHVGGSWASLFKNSAAPVQSTEKPTARISPFTASEPLAPGAVSEPAEAGDRKSKELGKFLLDYRLSHYAPALMPRGLSNRSNWCFVNAILQALLACPPFYNLFKNIPLVSGLKSGKPVSPMLECLIDFIHEFHPLETISKPQKREKGRKKEEIRIGSSLEPSYVYKMLLNLSSDTFKVVEGRQEDAEEFLTCLLNGTSDEMQTLIKQVVQEKKFKEKKDDEDEGEGDGDWKEVDSRGKSCITRRIASDTTAPVTPIQAMGLGMCRSSVKSEGRESSATLQPFFTLQLDIQNSDITSIHQALVQNFDSEDIDGYICQKTKQVVEASRSLSLEELPPILILHMKRFVYDGSTGGVQKVMKPVDFSVDLEIPKSVLSNEARPKYNTKQRQYKLFAVVYHTGREATKGHYVTDVYHTGYGTWLHCDDSAITETSEQSVITPAQTSTPYILFYRRCDTMVGLDKTADKK